MPISNPLNPNFLPSARVLVIALLMGASGAGAQDTGAAKGSIYSCVDGKGRRLTSDRPIVECLDREQRVLSGTGVVKRVVPPSYTAEERKRMEAERRLEEAARERVAEEKRRERALLTRYPNQEMHDKARAEALAQVEDVVAAVKKRANDLAKQRLEIDAEMEFYKSDISKAPSWLKRKVEDNLQQVDIQNRFLTDQAQERARLNARFDEELAKLRQLWAGK